MATLEQLEAGLKKAYDAGNMEYARVIGAEIVRERERLGGAAQIPSSTWQDMGREPIPQNQPQGGPSTLKGVGEAVLTGVTGAAATVPAALSAYNAALGGSEAPEQAFQRVMQGMTYQPSQEGVQTLQNVAQFMEEAKIPPVIAGPMGLVGMGQGLSRAVSQQVPLAQVAARAGMAEAEQAGKSIRAAMPFSGSVEKPKTSYASGGAAATEDALRRITTAEQLGFKDEAGLTLGMATRDPSQLTFEKNTAKMEAGGALRERSQNISDVLRSNFQTLIDRTDPSTTEVLALGKSVDEVLKNKMGIASRKISDAYTKAREAGQLDEMLPANSLAEAINSNEHQLGRGLNIDAIVRYAERRGAIENVNGTYVAKPVSINELENIYQEVNRSTSQIDSTQKYLARALKQSLNADMDSGTGDLYRKARAMRAEYAREFENVGLTKRLTTTKPGTDERRIAFEDVFKSIIVDSPVEEMNKVRRTLLTSGDDGKQAWKDLKAQGIQYLQEKSRQGMGTDSADNPLMSAGNMAKAIAQWDKEGKLEALYGKKQAQTIRDLGEIAAWVYTVPPGSALNTSNTALALMDAAATMSFTGLPVPAVTALREATKYMKNRELRARINAALNPKKGNQ